VEGAAAAQATLQRIEASEAENVLDAAERERLLAAFAEQAPESYPLVLFLAETGCRVGEALALDWPSVELSAQEAQLRRKKTGSGGMVELSSRLTECLRKLSRRMRRSVGSGAPEPVFLSPEGERADYTNFRRRVWDPVVQAVFPKRRFGIHGSAIPGPLCTSFTALRFRG
jgi:integrase